VEEYTYQNFNAVYEQVIPKRTDQHALQSSPQTHAQAISEGASLTKAVISPMSKKNFTIRLLADIRIVAIFFANLLWLSNYIANAGACIEND
jgi:hypothetical protein